MRDIVVTALIFGALPFVLRRPWLGILLWSWVGYMNPHRLGWGFAYNFPFAMVIAIVTIMAFVFSRDKRPMPWTRETVTLLAFLAWILLTTTLSFYPALAWVQWDRIWKIQLMVFLTVMMITDKKRLDWLIWVIVMSIGFYGVKGGVFTIATAGAFRVQGPTGSFIEGNNELALALIMCVPLIRYLHMQAEKKWIKLSLTVATVLTMIAAIGSQSRGALIALLAMGLFLWLKSRDKFAIGVYGAIVIGVLAITLPQEWYERMNTIVDYKEDLSAQSRINSWYTAYNVASSHLTGGGLDMFQAQTFRLYAPNPDVVYDAHSIYFKVMGEHGFIGLAIFLLLALFTWQRAAKLVHLFRVDPEKKWAADLAAMAQVSLVGYGAGGAFLGLSHFDLPYHIVIIVVLAARFSGALERSASRDGLMASR